MNKFPTIGILGGGQLAQMLALSGYPLGFRFIFFDPSADACAGLTGKLIVADYDNEVALDEFAQQCDYITYDFENVPVAAAEFVATRSKVFPHPNVLNIAQDRLKEKLLFSQQLDLPVANFEPVNSFSELMFAARSFDNNGFLKTRTMGYDGKGQYRVTPQADLKELWDKTGGGLFILEQAINFNREVSVILARNIEAEIICYELCENKHKQGILTTTMVPAKPSKHSATAFEYAKKIADKLNYVGVLTIEMFETDDGLLINEMAPRVHNSGHWTIEGAITSQFENHLRAGMGLPLGSHAMSKGYAAMINWIGKIPPVALSNKEQDIYWHIYGKQNRKGRKVGHTTVVADNAQKLHTKVVQLAKLLAAPTN
ncbi:N5-carboxyaminoimidazole ribonucleotide synthase [hydrothermal vent metagenome]|uniref:N5-carboxyaminoimidazole ribonucleotide synthase n=1 Tax=hydrothermal vent metagenome TaxID=652676 RepID=A0A3B0VTP5_9ZZZZ